MSDARRTRSPATGTASEAPLTSCALPPAFVFLVSPDVEHALGLPGRCGALDDPQGRSRWLTVASAASGAKRRESAARGVRRRLLGADDLAVRNILGWNDDCLWRGPATKNRLRALEDDLEAGMVRRKGEGLRTDSDCLTEVL